MKNDIQQAIALMQGGNPEAALELCRQYCRGIPDDPRAWSVMAHIHKQLGEPELAVANCRRVVELLPGSPDAQFNLALALQESGDAQSAITTYHTAIDLNPNDAVLHTNLACLLQDSGDTNGAIAEFRLARTLDPCSVDIILRLASLESASGCDDDAIRHLEDAATLEPARPEIHYQLGAVLEKQDNYEKAITNYRKGIHYQPGNDRLNIKLGALLNKLGDPDAALKCFTKAIETNPASFPARIGEIHALEKLGDYETASQKILPLIESSSNVIVALVFGKLCKHLSRCDEAIELLEKHVKQGNISNEHRPAVHFELGKLYEAKGDYGRSFTNYQAGNKFKEVFFDEWRHTQHFDSTISIFNQPDVRSMPRSRKTREKPRPVFIVGMPRSGTSLTEQILNMHPEVYGAGELTEIYDIIMALPDALHTSLPYPACMTRASRQVLEKIAEDYIKTIDELSGGKAGFVTNKMPDNYFYLGLIDLLFPNALVLNCVRDPLDTCISCYCNNFGSTISYVYDLEALGFYYRQYQRLMGFWKKIIRIPIHEVMYEDLVTDTETVVRDMLEFCRLEWTDRCLDFHKSRRFVNTASYAQVNKPVYGSSVGRWKRFDPWLGPLRKGLEGHG